MPEYIIVIGSSVEDITAKVQEKLGYGWKLTGGLTMGEIGCVDGVYMKYAQAMVRF